MKELLDLACAFQRKRSASDGKRKMSTRQPTQPAQSASAGPRGGASGAGGAKMAVGWDFQRRGPRKWDGAGPGRLASAGRRGLRKAERKACARRGPALAAAGGGARAARAGRISVSAALRGEAKMAASSWARKAVVLLWASDLLLLLLLLPPPGSCAAEGSPRTPDESTPPPRKKKKDIRDYNDADMARLLEQWEVRGALTPSWLFSVRNPVATDPLPILSWDLSDPLTSSTHALNPYPLKPLLTLHSSSHSRALLTLAPALSHSSALFPLPLLKPLQSRVSPSVFSLALPSLFSALVVFALILVVSEPCKRGERPFPFY